MKNSKPRRGAFRHRTRKKIIITDRELITDIKELAALTGESIERAIAVACDEELARIDQAMRRRVEWSRTRRASTRRPVRT